MTNRLYKGARLDITQVSQVTGLSTHLIRAWEKRHDVVRPTRTGNRRTYSAKDIARLKSLKKLTDQGIAIGEAVQREVTQEGPKPPLKPLIAMIEQYRFRELSTKLRLLRLSLGPEAFLLEIAYPLVAEVGCRIELGSLGVAQEHMISAIVREQVLAIRSPSPDPKLPSIAFCTPEGDFHELGILIGSKLAARRKHPLQYFGPNLPSSALKEALNATRPEILVIGTTAIASNLRHLSSYLKTALPKSKSVPDVWIAGLLSAELREKYRALESFEDFILALNPY